jgi:signal peptidase I
MIKGLLIWVRDIVIAVVAVIVIMQFISPTIVRGHSMDDTLYHNDYLFLSKQAYSFGGEPERGDIVVLRSDIDDGSGNTKRLIKRVIAVGGDIVEIQGGTVYVNGAALDEPYTKDGYTDGRMSEITVPAGSLFLLGDNRQYSRDSRDPTVGFVREGELVGRALFRVWPIERFGTVD